MSDLNLKLILKEANKKFKEKELGYFAETKFENNSNEKVELYSVSTEMFESSK